MLITACKKGRYDNLLFLCFLLWNLIHSTNERSHKIEYTPAVHCAYFLALRLTLNIKLVALSQGLITYSCIQISCKVNSKSFDSKKVNVLRLLKWEINLNGLKDNPCNITFTCWNSKEFFAERRDGTIMRVLELYQRVAFVHCPAGAPSPRQWWPGTEWETPYCVNAPYLISSR